MSERNGALAEGIEFVAEGEGVGEGREGGARRASGERSRARGRPSSARAVGARTYWPWRPSRKHPSWRRIGSPRTASAPATRSPVGLSQPRFEPTDKGFVVIPGFQPPKVLVQGPAEGLVPLEPGAEDIVIHEWDDL